MLHYNILIITDHFELAKTWLPGLRQMGANVTLVSCTKLPVLEQNKQCHYDIIVIDAYTPNFDFAALGRGIREKYEKVLLLLTYDRDERQHLLYYQSGITDVISKPISVPLFHAKIAVWLQHNKEQVDLNSAKRIQSYSFVLDIYRRNLSIKGGETMHLSSLECTLLALLMSNEGRVLETDLIIDRVWSNTVIGDENLLKNLIYRLRRKIEPDPTAPRYIHTVKGTGYVFRVDQLGPLDGMIEVETEVNDFAEDRSNSELLSVQT